MQIKLIKRQNTDNKGKNILVIGVFHGDEPQGEYLIERYLKECDGVPKNNVYYIPRLNFSNTRVNKNGVDLNRNFPTKNWVLGEKDEYFGGKEPASEEETKFIVALMEEIKFDAIITIHAPYKIVNYDGDRGGEALKLAEYISKIMEYPVQKDIGYPTPGSFGTYCGVERDIPTITIETDEEVPVETLYPKFKQLFFNLENVYY